MFFHLRNLPPLAFDELAASVALEALEWHLGQLANETREARDRADRPAWAVAQFKSRAASQLRGMIQTELEEMGPMPPEVADYHASLIERRGRKMPQSAANAAVLRAERAVRIEAEKARKAAYWARVEAGRRMAGGKWSRPQVMEGNTEPTETEILSPVGSSTSVKRPTSGTI